MASLTADTAARIVDQRWHSLSLRFYRAVRDLKPAWMLEEMRTMEALYQEDDVDHRTYTPSEALLYAIVHDHQAYARFLLSRYPEEALVKPGERFCCCPSSAPHLSMAVRYDRRCILRLILQQRRRVSTVHRGYFHTDGIRTPLHLACELLRPEAVIMLLGDGASPLALDHNGWTPLDVTLEKLRDCKEVGARQCLDILLMFVSKLRFKMRAALDREPELWSELLGEGTFRYLAERSPAPLVLIAMQTIVKQLSPATFLDSLHELPIPSSLKPPGLPVAQRDMQKML